MNYPHKIKKNNKLIDDYKRAVWKKNNPNSIITKILELKICRLEKKSIRLEEQQRLDIMLRRIK